MAEVYLEVPITLFVNAVRVQHEERSQYQSFQSADRPALP